MKPLSSTMRRGAVLAGLSCALVGAVAAQSATASTTPQSSVIYARTGAGPQAIVADAMGNVYTANARANNVSVVSASGHSRILGTTGQTPVGITLDSAGNVYTANTGANTVTKITPQGVSSTFGTTGRQPINVKVDAAGNAYTSNYVDSTVTKITPEGVSSVLAATGTHPLGLVLDPAGNVYTANEGSDNVTKITPDGTASVFGATGGWPQAIAIDGGGNVYTANWNSRNVSKITPAGSSSILGRTSRRPIGLTLDPYGNVYTTNDGSATVSRITPGGNSKVIANTGRRPFGITSDSAGFLYVSNFLSSTISEVFPPATSSPDVIALSTVTVDAPKNTPAWIIPFYNDVYESQQSCLAALPAVTAATQANPDPAVQAGSTTSCMGVGSVPYAFRMSENELTTAQYVTFLNTVDPLGKNKFHLWDAAQSSRVWPKFGSINRNPRAPRGQRYYVASPVWANKPYNVADFTRSARLANSLQNGKVLSKHRSVVTTASGSRLVRTTYTVRLSPQTETGMYTMSNNRATRNSAKGFAVSSQDEWIKAAYFDPNGGGKFSYWDYPTNPGLYVNCTVDITGCASGEQPNMVQVDANGDVTNATQQPLASFEPQPGVAPDWCPSQFTAAQCAQTPFTNSPLPYNGNVSSVGQALTRSPWGTLDQAGNTVEVTDTLSPPPALGDATIVWRRWHGGVVTATAYQLWLSAVGTTPQRMPGAGIQPWRGIRLVVRGR